MTTESRLVKPTFQQVILTLQQFWGERGCVLLRPPTALLLALDRALGAQPETAEDADEARA